MNSKTESEHIRRFLLGIVDLFELLIPKLREFAEKLKDPNSRRKP